MKTVFALSTPRACRWLMLAAGLATTGVDAAPVADPAPILEAIHQLENPRNLARPGPFGELGPYQFRITTWQMHTTIPFRRALERDVSDAVALKHYDYLKRGLERAGMSASPYNIALAWNAGLSAATRGKSPRAAHDYAARAANLVAYFDERGRVALTN